MYKLTREEVVKSFSSYGVDMLELKEIRDAVLFTSRLWIHWKILLNRIFLC